MLSLYTYYVSHLFTANKFDFDQLSTSKENFLLYTDSAQQTDPWQKKHGIIFKMKSIDNQKFTIHNS